jgi:hypothetical protein
MPIYKTLRPVAQEDEWGCGVACVASLLRCSYGRARNLLKAKKGANIDAAPCYGLELHHLALVLKDEGFHVVADWDEPKRYKPGTIVLIGIDGGTVSDEHYMVRTTTRQWMDPWINYPDKSPQAGLRDSFPEGKIFFVALVPKAGSKPG